MIARDLYALRPGVAPLHERACLLSIREAGTLTVPSGRVEIADPIHLGQGFVASVPAGTWPVRLTIADVSEQLDGSHLRVAYLSIVFHDTPVARVEDVVPEGKPAPEPGCAYCVPVDCATVGLADADAAKHIDGLVYEVASPWFDEYVFADRNAQSAEEFVAPQNVPMLDAQRGENYILSPSGWGDGSYFVYATRDAQGTLCGVHVDFAVVHDPHAEYNFD